MPRFLGLDWGEKRIGVSVSDDKAVFAVGYGLWPAEEQSFFTQLAKAVKEEEIDCLIVGYPLTLQDTAGKAAEKVDVFIAELEKRGYKVERWDERFSTFEASQTLTKLGITQKKQRGKIDMSAAVLILQSYLDSQSEKS